jgi:hypothetical protein
MPVSSEDRTELIEIKLLALGNSQSPINLDFMMTDYLKKNKGAKPISLG